MGFEASSLEKHHKNANKNQADGDKGKDRASASLNRPIWPNPGRPGSPRNLTSAVAPSKFIGGVEFAVLICGALPMKILTADFQV